MTARIFILKGTTHLPLTIFDSERTFKCIYTLYGDYIQRIDVKEISKGVDDATLYTYIFEY